MVDLRPFTVSALLSQQEVFSLALKYFIIFLAISALPLSKYLSVFQKSFSSLISSFIPLRLANILCMTWVNLFTFIETQFRAQNTAYPAAIPQAPEKRTHNFVQIFRVLADLVSACSASYWKRDIEISDSHCELAYPTVFASRLLVDTLVFQPRAPRSRPQRALSLLGVLGCTLFSLSPPCLAFGFLLS